MSDINYIRYTKDNGDESYREIIVVSKPRKNYLVYDVSNLSEEHRKVLNTALELIETHRENAMKDFELLTGIKQSSLWRSFKSGGIDWE